MSTFSSEKPDKAVKEEEEAAAQSTCGAELRPQSSEPEEKPKAAAQSPPKDVKKDTKKDAKKDTRRFVFVFIFMLRDVFHLEMCKYLFFVVKNGF